MSRSDQATTTLDIKVDEISDGGKIAVGEEVDGMIDFENDRDEWTFKGTSGERITISMVHADGNELDPFVQLISPKGKIETDDDDSGGSFNSKITDW